MTPLILDTDPGVDDAFALALAAASAEVDLRLVTTVFGNVELPVATDNALRLLALCNREDVPVAAGAERPWVHPHPSRAGHVHGSDGLSGRAASLPTPQRGVLPVDAVTAMTEVLHAAGEPVTVVAIGPLTNVASMLAAHPVVAPKIGRLIVLGGGMGRGNVTPAAEFNFWSDPEAARRVLVEERVPTVLVPLNLTLQCGVNGVWLERLRSTGTVGRSLVELTDSLRAWQQDHLGYDGVVLHDAIAVAEAVRPGLLATRPHQVEVDCSLGPGRGTLIVDRRHAGPVTDTPQRTVEVAVAADVDQLTALIADQIGGLDQRG